jgi:hypothetical protein
MRGNRGKTSLRVRRRCEDPMREFDRLPAELRVWLASAALPWRPRSVRRAYDKALAATGDRSAALDRLTELQGRIVARDAAAIWGPDHPAVREPARPGPFGGRAEPESVMQADTRARPDARG